MKSRVGVGVLAATLTAALTAGSLTRCEKSMNTSNEVPLLTGSLIVRINEVLDSTPEGQEIRGILQQINVPAVCMITSVVASDGMTDSSIVCETGPLPGRPGGLRALVGPVIFPTTIRPEQGMLTVGVTLDNGVLDPYSGCGILEEEIIKDGITMRTLTGSPHPMCDDINKRAQEIIDNHEQAIDEGLRGGTRL